MWRSLGQKQIVRVWTAPFPQEIKHESVIRENVNDLPTILKDAQLQELELNGNGRRPS